MDQTKKLRIPQKLHVPQSLMWQNKQSGFGTVDRLSCDTSTSSCSEAFQLCSILCYVILRFFSRGYRNSAGTADRSSLSITCCYPIKKIPRYVYQFTSTFTNSYSSFVNLNLIKHIWSQQIILSLPQLVWWAKVE